MIERVEKPEAFRELLELLVEYERDLPPDLRHGPEPRLEEVESTYIGQSAAFIARFGDRCTGCVAVRLIDPATAMLQRLYVQPAHRGHGTARALATAAMSFARERGCERIVLDTDAERLGAAAALYRSLGFTECEPCWPVDYERPTFMELRLR